MSNNLFDMNWNFNPKEVPRYKAMRPEEVKKMDRERAAQKPPRPAVEIAPRAATMQGLGEQVMEGGAHVELPAEREDVQGEGVVEAQEPSADEIAAYMKEQDGSDAEGEEALDLAGVKQLLAETAKTELAMPERDIAETAPTVLDAEMAKTALGDQAIAQSVPTEQGSEMIAERVATKQDDEPLPVQQVADRMYVKTAPAGTVIQPRGGLRVMIDRFFGGPTVTQESHTVVPAVVEYEPTQTGLEEETVHLTPELEAETVELPPVQE